MWSKELKKKKRISADTMQTFGANNGLSSNSSGGSNNGANINMYGSNMMTNTVTSSIPINTAGNEIVNTSNLLNLTASSSTGANKSNGSNGITGY